MAAGKDYVREAYHAILHNDFNRAIKLFQSAIQCEPDNASYHYKLSFTYARSNKIDEAVEEAEKAVQLRPEVQLYRYHLQSLKSRQLTYDAFSRMQKGAKEKNIYLMLSDAIHLDPLNMEARLLLAELYYQAGDNKQAVKIINEILRVHPHHREAKKFLQQLLSKE